MGVVVRRFVDILIIIITFLYSTCISSVFGSSIPTYLFMFSPFFKKEECQIVLLFFALHARKWCYHSDVIYSFDWKLAVEYDGGILNA